MKDYQPFDLSGPTQVYGAFYKQIADLQRSVNKLQGTTVKVAQLSEMSDDLGEVRAGVFVSSAAGDGSGFPGDGSFSGVVIAGAGVPTTNGDTGYISSWDTDVTQFYVGPDGLLYAGAGAVTLGADGITIAASNSAVNAIKFAPTSTPFNAAKILGYVTGSTPNRDATLLLQAYAEPGGNQDSRVSITAANGAGNSTGIFIQTDVTPFLQYGDKYNNSGSLHYGDYAASFSTAINSVTPVTLYTRTIKGGSLGTKGALRSVIELTDINASGANRTHTITYNFGTASLTTTFTAVNTATTETLQVRAYAVTFNDASASAQRHIMWLEVAGKALAGTFGAVTVTSGWTTGTDNTANDMTQTWTMTSNNATATQTAKGTVYALGPYYA